MMTYIDHTKYINNVKVVNLDIINRECRGDKVIGTYKDYKTIKSEHLTDYSKQEAAVVLSNVFRNKKDDLWIKHDLMIKLFGIISINWFCNFIR